MQRLSVHHSGSLDSNGMSFLPPKWCTTLHATAWSMRNGVFYVFISHIHENRVVCVAATLCHWRAHHSRQPFFYLPSLFFCVGRLRSTWTCIKLYQKMKLVREWDRTSLPFVFKNSTSDTGNKSSLILYLLLQRTAVRCVLSCRTYTSI